MICGGYTSKSWTGNGKELSDSDAFVFNMTQKYTPNNHDKAVFTYSNGFCFGDWILGIRGDALNNNNEGGSYTGKERFYNIEGEVSPLTGQKDFTCEQLEVYKITYFKQ